METETKESLFPPKEQSKSWGWWGYEGYCCDAAIRSDNVAMVKEAVERGWMVPETETLDGLKMVKYARKYGAKKVAVALVKLGWQDEQWPHDPVN
jgi:hypothetical protein